MEAASETPHDESGNDEKILTDKESEMIRAELREVRSRILNELYDNEHGVSTTYLRSPTGANVPKGSLNHHLNWLRGETDAMPESVPPLVEKIGEEDRGHSVPTKMIGITDTGRELVERMRDSGIVGPEISNEELKMAVQSNRDQIQRMRSEIERLEEFSHKIMDKVEDMHQSGGR